jgi:hypothetical protein
MLAAIPGALVVWPGMRAGGRMTLRLESLGYGV